MNCKIINISTYGLRLNSFFPHNIKNDDTLHIIFQLSAGTIIEKKIIVRNVQEEYMGCEFIDAREEDKEIGYYLI